MTSASSRPPCGRASGALSILTMRATRLALAAFATGRPVSGETGAAGGAVVEGAALVGGTDSTDLARSLAAFFPPPQAVRTRATTMKRGTARRMRVVSELPERFDSLVEGWDGGPAGAGADSFGRDEPQV